MVGLWAFLCETAGALPAPRIQAKRKGQQKTSHGSCRADAQLLQYSVSQCMSVR
jgi:hypothetical protein